MVIAWFNSCSGFSMIFAIGIFSCWCFFMQTRLIITLINCIAYPDLRGPYDLNCLWSVYALSPR